jgi:glycosyltransferase involved in cell wall biosynthesis
VKFRVVTPSYNQGRYIGETLASVRAAVERAPAHSVEHLVMDAGSTDETLDVLRAQTFAKWGSEPDHGQADAVNKGWARPGDADVLSFLCSDDLWEPDTVRLVAEAFTRDPEADVVYGDFSFLEGDSGWKRPKTAGPFSVERLRALSFLSQPATFIRRRVYERFGPLDASLRYCMDNEYWLRICERTHWRYVPHPLAVMRQHPDAKTSSQLTAAWWETAKMAERYGLGRRYWWIALRMQCGGQWYYAMKRKLFAARPGKF